MLRFVNDIVELELSFFVIISFIRKDKQGKNMSSKIYNILRQYQICIKFDNQRKML